MARSEIQFHQGLSLSEFVQLCGTEERYEAAPRRFAARMDFVVPAAMTMSMSMGLLSAGRSQRCQYRNCRHQATMSQSERTCRPPSCR